MMQGRIKNFETGVGEVVQNARDFQSPCIRRSKRGEGPDPLEPPLPGSASVITGHTNSIFKKIVKGPAYSNLLSVG